jgi:hypothetical protein
LNPEEILAGAIFTPPVVNIPTPHFQLAILPNRLQLLFQDLTAISNEQNANRVLGGILRQLPHTPLVGMGINFDYFVAPGADADFASWSRENFASPFALDAAGMLDSNPHFGSYFSMDFEGMRLKIDAKPVRSVEMAPTTVFEQLKAATNWMHVGFNYHKDLTPGTGTKDAVELVGKYRTIVDHANSMVKKWTQP